MKPLTTPPKIGDKVGVILHDGRANRPRITRRATVEAIRDHKPADGTQERNALIELSDDTKEFWWNLTTEQK